MEPGPDAGEIAKRKVAGNVVEVGSIAAFGFSPLWLLAAASDLTHGSRVYLKALEDELKAAGVIDEDVDAHSVDELLGVLESTSGGTARLVDIPPLELKELRASLAELRSQADSMPSPTRAGRTVDGAPPDGRRGEPLAARGLGRSRPGFPDLGAQGLGAAMWSRRTARTGSRCRTRALRRTPVASAGLTAARSRGTSTPARLREPSG